MAEVKPIALTCCDPSGVGPEIILRWLREYPELKAQIRAIGPPEWLDQLDCDGIACQVAKGPFIPGKPTDDGARVSWEALQHAADGCRVSDTE